MRSADLLKRDEGAPGGRVTARREAMEPAGLVKLFAVAEVLLAFSAVHLAFRAFKRFTAWGQAEVAAGMNFSPGVAMMAMIVLLLVVKRRRPSDWGLTPEAFFFSVNAASLALVILLLVAVGLAAAGARPARADDLAAETSVALVVWSMVATVLLLVALKRLGPPLERVPRVLSLLLLVAPFAGAMLGYGSAWSALLTILWITVGSGIGEEAFFRGYIQSRLNTAFGRPYRWCGVEFGPGLLGASLLFGLVHALNRYDWFTGEGSFSWWHGLATFATFHYGFLREKTGSIVAPAIVHAASNLAARLV